MLMPPIYSIRMKMEMTLSKYSVSMFPPSFDFHSYIEFSVLSVHVQILMSFLKFRSDRLLPTIEVSGMAISQSIEAPITTRDTVTMSGSLSSSNGNATGEIHFETDNKCQKERKLFVFYIRNRIS